MIKVKALHHETHRSLIKVKLHVTIHVIHHSNGYRDSLCERQRIIIYRDMRTVFVR